MAAIAAKVASVPYTSFDKSEIFGFAKGSSQHKFAEKIFRNIKIENTHLLTSVYYRRILTFPDGGFKPTDKFNCLQYFNPIIWDDFWQGELEMLYIEESIQLSEDQKRIAEEYISDVNAYVEKLARFSLDQLNELLIQVAGPGEETKKIKLSNLETTISTFDAFLPVQSVWLRDFFLARYEPLHWLRNIAALNYIAAEVCFLCPCNSY